MPRPALLPRAAGAGVLTLAALGTCVIGAPTASAMVVPGGTTLQPAPGAAATTTHLLDNSSVSFLGTPDRPVAIGTGALHLFVGEEQGNELGVPVDLGGATVRVTFTSTSGTDDGPLDESYTCTTDQDGACVFEDADGEFDLSPFPGDVVTVEQLSAPTSGLFTLPPAEDRVVHAAVPASAPGAADERTAPSDVVVRMAPDVLGNRDRWTQIVFFAPLATEGDPSTGEPAPGVPAPDAGTPADADTPSVGGAPGTQTAGGATTSSAAAAAPSTGAAQGSLPSAVGADATGAPSAVATSGPRPTASGLATTGSELGPVVELGGLLLLAGGSALVAVRRRAVR